MLGVILGCGPGAERTLDLLPASSTDTVEAVVRVPAEARLELAWTAASPATAGPGRLEVWAHAGEKPGVLLHHLELDGTDARAQATTVDLGSHHGELLLLRVRATPAVLWHQAVLAGRSRQQNRLGRMNPTAGAAPPDVLVYLVDTLRPDVLGPYGGPVATPTFDRLAATGTLFERAYSTASWTRPAVASLFTGLHVSAHGVASEEFELPDAVLTLAERFRLRGYQTMGVVANGHVSAGLNFDQGFEIYRRTPPPQPHGGTWDPDQTIRSAPAEEVHALALRELAQRRDRSRPLFLYVHVVDPHEPYEPPEWLLDAPRPTSRFNNYLLRSINESGAATEPLLRDLALAYQGAVSYTDRELGRFLSALGQQIDLDRTVLAVTSDHGEAFFEHHFVGHRNELYEELTRVPLLLVGPGVPAATRNVELASLVDLVPTLLALADGRAPEPAHFQGLDLLAAASTARRTARSVASEHSGDAAFVAAQWKLTYHHDRPEELRFGLFDLRADPAEENDLFASRPAVARRMLREMRAWQAANQQAAVVASKVDESRLDEELIRNLQALGYAR